MQFREYCDIRVSGHDLYRFVNALRQSSAACGEQHIANDKFCGRILRRDLATVQEVAAQCGMTLEIREQRSVLRFFRRFRLRFGIFLGILAGVAIIFWQSNVVETIEFQGTQTVDPQTLTAVLEQEGVRRGTWIGNIDMFRVETRLVTSDERIAWAGIHRTGNRIVVQIAEARQNLPMLHERIPSNIIAAHDAQITQINVHAGTLQRHLGDGVTRGTLLVSGVQCDEYGHTVYQHANAEITGIYTRKAELTEYFSQTETTLTGQTFTRKGFRLFGLHIPLTAGTAHFDTCKVTQTETPLAFLGFRLPCAILRETSQETVTLTQVRTEADTRLALNAQIVRYEQFLLRDVTILSRELSYETSPDGITAHLTYRVEGEIGEPSEIFCLP